MNELRRDIRLLAATRILLLSSENLIICFVMAWALQLIYLLRPGRSLVIIDTTSLALIDLHGRIPILYDGIGLLLAGLVHLASIRRGWKRTRCGCIFVEMLFLLFAWWSILLSRLMAPGVTILPVMIVFCMGNLLNQAIWRLGGDE